MVTAKSEARNQKFETNSNDQNSKREQFAAKAAPTGCFEHLTFGFLICLEFRASDF
jgi:hypothetical protein